MSFPIRNTHIEVAERLILSYTGEEPFATYLRKYFSANKKHGSRDRKQIAALCYGYFRLGNGVIQELVTKEKIELGYFLSQTKETDLGENNLQKKLQTIKDKFDPSIIFPFNKHLSPEIDALSFNLSFLKQPHLYIRIRPGHENAALKKLEQNNIDSKKIDNHCIRVDNATQLQSVLKINKEAVIQDYNSQRVAKFFEKVVQPKDKPIRIWDCCAASGGKSILAKDHFKNIELTVSDNRKSILHNLKKRFTMAGIKDYNEILIDLSQPVSNIPGSPFDLIIADIPCSGSGTWARTPEQLSKFQEEHIHSYASLQRSIVQNAIKHLKPQGFLMYVTCSVFKEENDENVKTITERFGMKMIAQEYLKGYEMQADTLFGVVMGMA